MRRKKVLLDSILPLDGSGAIGRKTARSLRASHPELAFVIGGRSLAKSDKSQQIMVALRASCLPRLPMTSDWAPAP